MERKWNSQVHCISLLMIQNGSRLGFITTLMTRLVWKGRGVIWPSKTLQKGSTWLLNLRTWNKQSHYHSFQSLVISFPQFLQVVILLFFLFFCFYFYDLASYSIRSKPLLQIQCTCEPLSMMNINKVLFFPSRNFTTPIS